MTIGLRILALIIDVAGGMGSFYLVMSGFVWGVEQLGDLGVVLMPFLMVLVFTWPFLYLGIPTGIWGKTPGKFICRLTVTNFQGRPPGIWRGLGREVLKCLAIGSGFGILFTLYQMITQGGTWYDQLCGTRVDFSPPVSRSTTQKNWRKFYKEK